jgi:SAM-dependent methyltransferase
MRYLFLCPICDHPEFFALEGYDYKPGPKVYEYLGIAGNKSYWSVCESCGFIFQNPRPEPRSILSLYQSGLYRKNKHYTEEFFKTRYSRPLRHLAWATKSNVSLPKETILDIGAGFGGAVRAFRDKGFAAVGVELDPEICSIGEERFDIELINSDILDCDFPKSFFGMIYSAHAHEHFDDLDVVNRKLASWLAPGGYLLCVLPTYRLSARNGQGFINVFHNSIFTKTSLYNMFVKCGLHPKAFRYPLRHSLAEVWGLARKADGSSLPHKNLRRDNWKFVVWEVQNAPRIFEFLYKIIAPFNQVFARGASWLHKE